MNYCDYQICLWYTLELLVSTDYAKKKSQSSIVEFPVVPNLLRSKNTGWTQTYTCVAKHVLSGNF